ncbi:hypothetical protein OUZ56_010654 [Daphnia magna]|uniref:Uncharacterized protein n=1 Tax=Daphnia magna TaxID=35525 RepID=A0ABR0AJ63_9CRUS|nr:hypothetical protein OUZ56_010654 [Daphnia magna]
MIHNISVDWHSGIRFDCDTGDPSSNPVVKRSIIHSHLHVHVILTSSVVDSGSSRLRQLVQRRLDKELKIENSNNSNIVRSSENTSLTALFRAVKTKKNTSVGHPNRISGCPEDIKKMYSTSDPDICRTSDGLPCVMWGS